MKTTAIINNKGGVGKTTTSIHLAAGMARRNRKVLLVDLDSQASASLAAGADRKDLTPSVADVLFKEATAESVVRSTSWPSLDLLTGSLDLANADTRLSSQPNRAQHLRSAIEPVASRYDLIVLDCAPSTSSLTINALVAADTFIIPTSSSYLSLKGIVSLGKVITRVRRGIGETGPVLGILVTMVDPDEPSAETIEALREHYGGKVFETVIRRDPALKRAPARGETVFEYAPDSRGAADYAAFLDEVDSRLKRYGSVVDLVTG
jgi:chromosome partitioning protein